MTDQATLPRPVADVPEGDSSFLDPEFAKRDAALLIEFQRAAVADPALLDGVPHGTTLVLLPDNEPEFFERRLALGLAAIRQGRNVLFRHWPVPPGH
jgi:hypothetical protein